MAGEGTLDPLGTGILADRLADQIAPAVTARMTRIRFVTAMTVASVVVEPFADQIAADGVTPPFLVFEWLLVEALAKDRSLPQSATRRVPGIDKARSAWARKQHLDARSYLKVPQVFGFHGIYKRLAVGIETVDELLYVRERGADLLRAWETEQGLVGFGDGDTGSEGGRLLRSLRSQVEEALRSSRLQTPTGSSLWTRLVRHLRPDGAGSQERRLLYRWLTDPAEPLRRELILLVEGRGLQAGEEEWESLRGLRPRASAELDERLLAIDRYERFCELITAGFDHLRRSATAAGTRPVAAAGLDHHQDLIRIAGQVPAAFDKAAEAIEPLGHGPEFEAQFGLLGEVRSPRVLADALLERHNTVQSRKGPGGKRAWFESYADGFMVRPQYRADVVDPIQGRYLHPFRVNTLRSFLRDLR